MTTASKPKAVKTSAAGSKDKRVFEFEVQLIDGPVTDAFCKANKKVLRTIEIRGNQTLEKLHEAIFKAFDRQDHHLYEFRIGSKDPFDDKAVRYVMPFVLEDDFWRKEPIVMHDLTGANIDSLGLKVGAKFYYWFDFGDDWWHSIKVVSIGESAPGKRYPQITGRIGDSPPQYVDWDEEE